MTPEAKDRLIDTAAFVWLIGLPHTDDGWARAIIALVAVPIWVFGFEPSWRGLRGFYYTAALVVQALVTVVLALW